MKLSRHRAGFVPALVCLFTMAFGSMKAQEPVGYKGTSLDFLPASTTIYSAHLRIGEQFQWLMRSKAVQNLLEAPAIKKAMAELPKEMFRDPQAKMVWDFLHAEENKNLLELIKDVAANEIYIAGGPNLPGLLQTIIDSYGDVYAQMQLSGLTGGRQDPKQIARSIFKALNSDPEKFTFPEVVLGFKVKNANANKEQQRLEQIVTMMIDRVPFLQGKLKNGVEIAGGKFTVFEIAGKDLPLDQIPWGEIEEEVDEFKKLKTRLSKLTFTVAIGIQRNYLTLSIGPDTKFLGSFTGSGKLADIPEMKPLQQFNDKKILSIGYTSKAFSAMFGYTRENVAKMVKQLNEKLEETNLPEDLEKKLIRDLKDLGNDMYALFGAESGATSAVEFAIPTGREGFSYFFGTLPNVDSSKPLTILEHVGEKPILVAAGRGAYRPENWNIMVKWCKKGDEYIREFLLPQLPEQVQAQVEEMMNTFYPLLKRFDKNTRENYLPGFADSQTALVVDGGWSSKQWHKDMPASDTPLPMPRMALVVGVSDSKKVEAAMTEYRKIVNDTITALREKVPGPFPEEVRWADPKTKTTANGTYYYYDLPAEAGVDKQVGLFGGLSSNVAVLALSEKHVETLFAKKTASMANTVLEDQAKKRFSAMYFNMPELMNMLDPLSEFVGKMETGKDAEEAKDIMRRAKKVLRLIGVASSESYTENNVNVTHHRVNIQDQE